MEKMPNTSETQDNNDLLPEYPHIIDRLVEGEQNEEKVNLIGNLDKNAETTDTFLREDPMEEFSYYQEYLERRAHREILYSNEMREEERLEAKGPQLILMSGMTRSGKSEVADALKEAFDEQGVTCTKLSSDNARKFIIDTVTAELLENYQGDDKAKQQYKESEEFNKELDRIVHLPENKQWVYLALNRLASEELAKTGGVVIVDKTALFQDDREDTRDIILGLEDNIKDSVTREPIKTTYIEVSNSDEDANKIFDDVEAGLGNPEDNSMAYRGIRERMLGEHEPFVKPHIKVVNDRAKFKTIPELRQHVKEALVQKPKQSQTQEPPSASEVE